MELREFTYITTVAEYKSITKAANKLYISQPSLSNFIMKTEERIGVKLFDRSTNPISLTYAGERYIETARQILMLNKNLMGEFRDIALGMKGRIRIGIPKERAAYMLPLVLPKFTKKYPGIEVQVLEARTSVLMDSVIKGQTDFILIPQPMDEDNGDDNALECELIYEEGLVLICKEGLIKETGCRINHSNQIDITHIENLPLLILKKGHGIRMALDDFFEKHGVTPKIAMELSGNLTACRLAIEGFGAAVVPELTVHLAQNIKEKDIHFFSHDSVKWRVVALYRRDSYIGRVEKDFFEILRAEIIKKGNLAIM